MFYTFAGSLVTLVTCLLLGIVGRKKKIFSDESDHTLSSLLVKFTLPATVFMSMLRPFSGALLLESALTILIISIVFLSGLLLGTLLSYMMNASPKEKRIWQLALVFPNVTYIGFPLIQSVFGDEGMIYASMVTMVFNVMAFSLGIHLIKSDNSQNIAKDFYLKHVLFAPAFAAVFIGFFFFISGIRLPIPIERGIGLVGNMTTPLAMMLIGSLLSKLISENGFFSLLKDWRVYPIVAVRLIFIPLVTFFILNLFIDNVVMLGTIVTLAAMPVATLTAIFAEQYGGNTTMALKTIALSDIFCLLTIPLLSLLLQQ